MRTRRPISKWAQRRNADSDTPPMLEITPEGCVELNICPRCHGDLGETPQRRTDEGSILGPYRPCDCPKLDVLEGGKEKQMAATPSTDLDTLKRPFENVVAQLRGKAAELANMSMGLLKANVAKEFDHDAAHYLEMLDKSELTERINSAYQTHKFLVKLKKTLEAPAYSLRTLCRTILMDYERMRRQQEDAERRKREQEALAEQERIRAEEIKHLQEQGHKQEAEDLAQEPIEVSLPEEKEPVGKVDAVAFTDVWNASEIVDGALFFTWLSKNPAFWGGLELKPGFWKRALTANKGTLIIPGLKITKSQEVRNRGD